MRYDTYLYWGVLGALFAVLFVPFVIADGAANWATQPMTYIPFFNMFFPYITGKNFVFRILVEIALILYVLLALKRPEFRPRASHVLYALGGLVVWMGLATLLSVDPLKSFWSNFERMEGYVGLVHLFVFFVIAGAVLTQSKLWDKFLTTSVGASTYIGFLALLQIMGALPISSQSGARADINFGNATYLAVYMLIHFFLTLYLLSRERVSRGMQAFYGIALVLQAMGIYYTQTRGALLGLVGGLIIAAIYVAVRGSAGEYASLRKWALGGLTSIVVLAGLFVVLRDTPIVQSSETLARLASISVNDPTTRSRLFNIWPMAVSGGLERPITGWGQENFSYIFNANYRPEMYIQEAWFDRAHNQFLDYLVAGGVPAFLLYLSLYALAAWVILRSALNIPQQAALIGLLAAYAFNNMFVFDNLGSAIFFMVLLAFIHGLSRKELPSRILFTQPVSDRALSVVAPALVVVMLVASWSLNAPGIARARHLTAAVSSTPDVAFTHYQAAINSTVWPYTALGYQESVEQLMQFASAAAGNSAVDPALRDDIFALATSSGERLVAMRKDDARIELFLSSLYNALGDEKKSLEYARSAVALSPQKQQLLFQLGGMQLEIGDVNEALKTFERAWRLAPEYTLARLMYAQALYLAGDTRAADLHIQEHLGDLIVDDDRLLSIYTATRQYDRAVAIWQLRIDKSPEDVNLRVGLAQLYLKAGNKAKAIEILRTIPAIRPTLTTQIEQIIQQIQSGLLSL
ncbi:O-antigen ligase family protein [Candidatus Nomurabacteria bacterium]|nr:O-antigen ligase family protein [Candidatus Nomurabacteria bacterium]